MLEAVEVVLPDDGGAGVGAVELPEDGHHGWWPGPVGDHGVGHLGQAHAGLHTRAVETLVVLYGVRQSQPRVRGRELLQSRDCLEKKKDILDPFMLVASK